MVQTNYSSKFLYLLNEYHYFNDRDNFQQEFINKLSTYFQCLEMLCLDFEDTLISILQLECFDKI